MQFSTKWKHTRTGYFHYGARFYSPNLGRWINRDPIGEAGGMNLYGFVGNDPMNAVDSWGESPISWAAKRAGKAGIKEQLRKRLKDKVGDRLDELAWKPHLQKELADDMQDILDILDSDSIPEVLVEMIPVVGDAYGGLKLCKGMKEAWDKVNKLEERIKRLLGTKQVFLKPNTRKRAMDAIDAVGPFQKRSPTSAKIKTQGAERHKVGGWHMHDKNHENSSKPNVHYGIGKR